MRRPRQARGGGRHGAVECRASPAFTLIELLTVLAIIGVLATLLLTALGAAQKKSREARCIGNLRQISLGLSMYLDDSPARPPHLAWLRRTRYVDADGVFVCPQDRTGNWAGLVDGFAPTDDGLSNSLRAPEPVGTNEAPGSDGGVSPTRWFRYSYLSPLGWANLAWEGLVRLGSRAGVAACQVHGLGRPNLEFPSVRDFEGLVLRVRRDLAVVRRNVFWADRPVFSLTSPDRGAAESTGPPPSAAPDAPATDETWPFFSDEPARY